MDEEGWNWNGSEEELAHEVGAAPAAAGVGDDPPASPAPCSEEALFEELFPPAGHPPADGVEGEQDLAAAPVAPAARVAGPVEHWGAFLITRTAAARSPPHGGLRASCPFHKLNDRTGCKKFVTLREGTAEHEECVRQALRHWCNQARHHDRQRGHMGHAGLDIARTPAPEVVLAERIDEGPASTVIPDAELDRVAAAAALREERAQARVGRGPGGGRAVGRAAARAPAGRGRGGRGSADEPSPGGSSSSSSSSDSSSSD